MGGGLVIDGGGMPVYDVCGELRQTICPASKEITEWPVDIKILVQDSTMKLP